MLSYSAARMDETWGNALQPECFEVLPTWYGQQSITELVGIQPNLSETPILDENRINETFDADLQPEYLEVLPSCNEQELTTEYVGLQPDVSETSILDPKIPVAQVTSKEVVTAISPSATKIKPNFKILPSKHWQKARK